MSRAGGVALAVSALVTSACTFLNAFEDVLPSPAASPTTSGAGAAAGGAGGEAGATTTTSTVTGTGPGGGAGAEILAVGGRFLGQEVLYALDRSSGLALANEPLAVAAIGYDGWRDLWYVFSAPALPVPPGGRGRVEVRSFAPSGAGFAWQTLGAADNVLLPRAPGDLVVLRDAVATLVDREGAPGTDLSVLGTKNPESLQLVFPERTDVSAGAEVAGALGRESIASGGTVEVVRRVPLGGASCKLELLDVTVTLGGVTVAAKADLVGPAWECTGRPSWALDRQSAVGVLVLPPEPGKMEARLVRYSHVDHMVLATTAFAVAAGAELAPMAVASCEQLALVGVRAPKAELHVVPLGPGTGAKLAAAGAPIATAFEPVAKRVLAPFATARSFGIPSFDLEGRCDAPALASAADWVVPVYLEPRIVVTEQALPVGCPGDCML
jgi:hypothetical protein